MTHPSYQLVEIVVPVFTCTSCSPHELVERQAARSTPRAEKKISKSLRLPDSRRAPSYELPASFESDLAGAFVAAHHFCRSYSDFPD
jgi:hypothetical protein